MRHPDPLSDHERFQHLRAVISSKRFLAMQGLGNEVPFFICPYDPKQAVSMQRIIQQLCSKLSLEHVHVLEVNLFDLAIELLQERDILDQVLAIESETSKDKLLELMQNVLDPEAHLIPAIGEKLKAGKPDVLFLTGVGAVFPYIRSHNVLNNLQSTAKDLPTVMFFPGEYTHSLASGASLDLFGLLHDDKYYRAFNIYEYEA